MEVIINQLVACKSDHGNRDEEQDNADFVITIKKKQ